MSKKASSIYKKLNRLDWSIVDRKLKSVNLKGNSILSVKKEALRYLSICAVKEGPFAPSPIIDEYWDEMILDTPTYAKAAKVIGRFIHHIQNDGTIKERNKDLEAFWSTIQAYEEIYGEPNLKVWELKRKKSKKRNRIYDTQQVPRVRS